DFSITSPFGYRTDPITGESSFHDGVDIAAPESTAILAAADGVVVTANRTDSWGGSYGYYVLIQHDETYETLYAHCSEVLVKAGQEVEQGDIIALVGSTGNSTGNHLHFEVREGGSKVDPMEFFQKKSLTEDASLQKNLLIGHEHRWYSAADNKVFYLQHRKCPYIELFIL
ncbi:MAG TPA: M23 family metallopeptidase, partial [Candidatus Limivivens intestinipullorum]|nr:M23 family metallopeptidase [Candidatus Limivivens intestinipullorum]